ncbi:50S ribosomal protein L31 [Mycoplasmoides genitalium]
MKKAIHFQSQPVVFNCASCNSNFTIDSTAKQKDLAIDICGKCHPFYIGQLTKQTVHGRAEKLSQKFNAGKAFLENKTKKSNQAKVEKQTRHHSINEL